MNPIISTVIFIGPQGSGKGTQAHILVRKLNAKYLEAGEILRRIATEDTEFGRHIKGLVESGALVEDDIWRKVVLDELESWDDVTPVVIDGSPRRIGQAKILIDHLLSLGRTEVHTIFIDIPKKESIRRLLLRRYCAVCKNPAIATGDPDQVCVFCGGALIKRNDETEAAISKRLALYEQETIPVVKYLQEHTIFHPIDGKPQAEIVSQEIELALGLDD